MERRRLGRTGLDVSILALNAGGLDARACKDFDLEAGRAAMALALDSGINALASPADAHAASLAAEILRSERRDREVHILSRVPPRLAHNLPSPHLHADAVFPAAHIRACTEAALQMFGVEQLAVQLLPAWQPEWTEEGEWLETLERLKAQGKIAGFGVAPFDHDPGAVLDAASRGVIDCVEVMYNPFDPEAAADLFPVCVEKDVGVIVRSPLYGGALTPGWDETRFAPGDWREAFFYPDHRQETAQRAAALAAEAARGETVADLALRFCLSHPAVSTISVGMRRLGHVQTNVAAAARGPIEAGVLARLAAHKWLC